MATETKQRELTEKEKLLEIQKECKTNLRFLCRRILNMQDWESPLHDELWQFLAKPGKQKLILMPRGHLKTSIVTVGYVIQRLLRDPNMRILINNAVWDNARTVLYQISEYLTTKSPLPRIFGPFQAPNGKWTRDEIEIAHKTDVTKRGASVSTGGVESAKTGLHYDMIIHDDIVVRENVSTKEQIQKVITFYRDSLDLLDPGGQMLVVGTRWALGDLYGHLMESEMASINGHVLKSPEERLDWRKYIAI